MKVKSLSMGVIKLVRSFIAKYEPTENFYGYVCLTCGILSLICFLGGHWNVGFMFALATALFYQKPDFEGVDAHVALVTATKDFFRYLKERKQERM